MTTHTHTTDDRPTDTQPRLDYHHLVRCILVAIALGAALALVMTTLGLSRWLVLIAGLAIPIIAAWLTLCSTLEANEAAIDVMLDERAATFHESVQAMCGQPAQRRAYTGTTVKLDEVQQ